MVNHCHCHAALFARRVWQNPPSDREPEGKRIPWTCPSISSSARSATAGRSFGAWLVSGAPSTAEALGCAGFDFLVVDMEHTPVDTPQMVDILRTIAGTPAQAVVRLPWNDMVMVKRALDGGAQTLLLPFVQNADEARRAVALHALPARRRARRRRQRIAAAASAPCPTTSRPPRASSA